MRHIMQSALLAAMLAATMPAAAATRTFLTKAVMGDNSEITLGTIAAQRGTSAGVRQFGQALVTDHRHARTEAARVARRHHIAVRTSIMPEAATERRKLMNLHGRAFDREFARYMVEDHQKDIADFTRESRSHDPADVLNLARATLPTLRHHLSLARALSSR